MAAYADSTDLTERYDEGTLGDLSSDTGTPPADLSADSKVTTALLAASGAVDAALLVGKMYDVADLASLETNSLALLKDIVCGLAMVRLLRRRPEKFSSEAIKEMSESFEGYLDRLRQGERLFEITDDTTHQDAGVPTIDGPRTVDYDRLHMLPDRTHNFYPDRGSRLPTNRR